MNLYFNLGIPERDVKFGHIWFKTKDELRNEFADRQDNRPLQALYWLSKDLFERGDRFLEPEADEIRAIRNCLEHKYLKIIDFADITGDSNCIDPLEDKIAYKISRGKFIDKGIYLLKLVRSAIIYLLLAVEYEEKNKPSNDNVISLPVMPYDDEWKR